MYDLTIGLLGTCVNQKYVDQIQACLDTWIKDCPKNVNVLFLCGDAMSDKVKSERIIHLINAGDDYHSATNKQWLGLEMMFRESQSKFYFIGGTDNYINVDRMLRILEKYDYEYPWYIGGNVEHRIYEFMKVPFILGGGGFILSHNALEQIVPLITEIRRYWDHLTSIKEYEPLRDACDVAISHLTHILGIPMVSEIGLYPCDWVQGWPDTDFIFKLPNWNYDKWITFHYMTPEMMYLCHRLKGKIKLYRLLEDQRREYKRFSHDISEHLNTLYRYSLKCSDIIVTGRNNEVMPDIIKGLVDSNVEKKKLTVLNLNSENIRYSEMLCEAFGIEYIHIVEDPINYVPTSTPDLVFIDDWHCYGQVIRELRNFKDAKYIILHDTVIDDYKSEGLRCNFTVEHPTFTQDEMNIGIIPAITKFLVEEPKWKIIEEYTNNNGLIVLAREI